MRHIWLRVRATVSDVDDTVGFFVEMTTQFWICPKCTLGNLLEDLHCAACHHRRDRHKSRSKSISRDLSDYNADCAFEEILDPNELLSLQIHPREVLWQSDSGDDDNFGGRRPNPAALLALATALQKVNMTGSNATCTNNKDAEEDLKMSNKCEHDFPSFDDAPSANMLPGCPSSLDTRCMAEDFDFSSLSELSDTSNEVTHEPEACGTNVHIPAASEQKLLPARKIQKKKTGRRPRQLPPKKKKRRKAPKAFAKKKLQTKRVDRSVQPELAQNSNSELLAQTRFTKHTVQMKHKERNGRSLHQEAIAADRAARVLAQKGLEHVRSALDYSSSALDHKNSALGHTGSALDHTSIICRDSILGQENNILDEVAFSLIAPTSPLLGRSPSLDPQVNDALGEPNSPSLDPNQIDSLSPNNLWFYQDDEGVLFGGFDHQTLVDWVRKGFFHLDVPMRLGTQGTFQRLRDLIDHGEFP